MRNSFIFYRTVYDTVKDIPMEIRDEVLMALMEFGLNGKEVPIKSPVAKAVFNLLKGPVEIAFKKYENAIKGGAPKGNSNNRYSKKTNNQTTTKEQPKYNQTTTETQPEDNQETTEVQTNNKIIREYDNSLISPPISPSGGESMSEAQKDFEKFWEMYGKKVGKKKAELKFLKLSKADREKIFETLPAYIANTPDVNFRKDPLTYLNAEAWNDEIIQRNETRQQSAKSWPTTDHSQYRNPNRSYPTISDF